ncbi:similar to Saccharomyces cerevisiae YIL014W MNT3 Alpha-1,3-mannosyltransferase [Maudiozyma saulgeensis]|uniref:Similar to Saccharomyces cerevisiae YIL014W MNT3 Alpha-1,3-mannosyltransferase n=1 Tax=Maudiozyma saulgeensis TaxID=1789683 RepID=A0A1X7QW70_9SACH|nr:similar to Saccharomyces cerevisiae YIL014W MNT3 Alpha-1,3-mannosyltransferase [Kazachstania saulgeensis]
MFRIRLKRLLTLRFLLLLSIFYAIYRVSTSRREAGSTIDNTELSLRNYRDSTDHSPFKIIAEKRDEILKTGVWSSIKRKVSLGVPGPSIFKDEDRFIMNWRKQNSQSDRLKKCQFIISSMYFKQSRWSNRDTLKFYSNDELDNSLIELLGERMRTYDYCFLKGNLSLTDVFDSSVFKDKGIDAWDYQSRMFPFLSKDFNKESKYMWPDIIDLTTGLKSNKLNDVGSGNTNTPPLEFNINFWANWLKHSEGKGIVSTMAPSDAATFSRQLKVFQNLNNTLPIQVVSTGHDLTPEFIDELANAATLANQQVFIVDCSKFFDSEFTENYIKNFFNKWVAVIMNTFEESMFIDVDAVLFKNTTSFFNIPDYQATGIYMYQDRTMPEEHTFQYCIEMLKHMTPSKQERDLLGSHLFIDDLHTGSIVSTEAIVYQNFFNDLRLHHVDSGLVIINKVKKLNGLLMSFLLHLDGKMQRCVYGDKEIFWLGELFAGEDYTIDPFEGGIVGGVGEYTEEQISVKKAYICATQIAHSNVEDQLVWTNGGLKTCKIFNAAEDDFAKDESYYSGRYKTVDNLEEIYNSPLVIEGFISPDPFLSPWKQINECSNYMYCAFVTEDTSIADITNGKIIRFNEKDKTLYNSISRIWNE